MAGRRILCPHPTSADFSEKFSPRILLLENCAKSRQVQRWRLNTIQRLRIFLAAEPCPMNQRDETRRATAPSCYSVPWSGEKFWIDRDKSLESRHAVRIQAITFAPRVNPSSSILLVSSPSAILPPSGTASCSGRPFFKRAWCAVKELVEPSFRVGYRNSNALSLYLSPKPCFSRDLALAKCGQRGGPVGAFLATLS